METAGRDMRQKTYGAVCFHAHSKPLILALLLRDPYMGHPKKMLCIYKPAPNGSNALASMLPLSSYSVEIQELQDKVHLFHLQIANTKIWICQGRTTLEPLTHEPQAKLYGSTPAFVHATIRAL